MTNVKMSDLLKSVFIRKYLQNHLAHKIHIFCPIDFIDFNEAENVNFVCQMVLQVFSYKKTDFRTDK